MEAGNGAERSQEGLEYRDQKDQKKRRSGKRLEAHLLNGQGENVEPEKEMEKEQRGGRKARGRVGCRNLGYQQRQNQKIRNLQKGAEK